MSIQATALSCLAFVFLVGCSSLPDEDTTELSMDPPESWTGAHVIDPAKVIGGWLNSFQDPQLSALAWEALQNSPTIDAAEARLRAALGLALANSSNLWPTINGVAGASDSQTINTSTNQNTRSDAFNAGGTISWELDLWGRVRAEAGAARADRETAIETFAAARLSLVANIARQWFNLREARAQEALAKASLDSFENNLNLIEDRYQSGVSTSLDVRLLRANVANARANLASRQRAAEVASRALEVLVGRYPASALDSPLELPALQAPPPAGLPAGLLARRPDLIASERTYQSAVFSAKESRRARLPRISLTGSAGLRSDEVDDLLRGDFGVWSLAGNLTAPLFQGGQLKGAARRTQALADAALANYVSDALTAFQEVENALAGEAYWRSQTEALAEAASESAAAEEQAWQRYQRGLSDIITVLESQRRALTAHASLLASQNQSLQNRINLHLALGGDFESLPKSK